VSRFQADWLRLREPYDHASRSAALAAEFAKAVGPSPRLVDLGCGTGGNLRYLASRLPAGQRWLLVDHDPALLERARLSLERPGFDVRFQALNLAEELPDLADCTGITASALLDLASAAWLERLAGWCGGRPLLTALTFDGRLAWQPAADEDAAVRERFLAHQRTDKGFGPALGADAAGYFAGRLEAQGGRVAMAISDWVLGPLATPLLAATLEGIIGALAEIDPAPERWVALRRRQLAAGELHLTVGHVDLLALPARDGRARDPSRTSATLPESVRPEQDAS
jgi:SAM-dependent methyltransferase